MAETIYSAWMETRTGQPFAPYTVPESVIFPDGTTLNNKSILNDDIVVTVEHDATADTDTITFS